MSKFQKLLLYFLFFLVGISTVLIGQVLPFISARFLLTDAQSSKFFIAHFAGSILGILVYEFIVKSRSFLLVIRIGCVCAAVGVILLNSEFQFICSAGFFLNGVCTGANIPAINMLMAKVNPSNTVSSLSFLNFFWGVGAITCQPFIYAFADEGSLLVPTTLLSVLYLLACVFLRNSPKGERERKRIASFGFREIWSNPISWLIAFFNFAHVGLESGIGGWLTTYSERFYAESLSATPVFFTFFVLGRLLAPISVRFCPERLFVLISLLILNAGLLLILISEKSLFLGASICGIGASAIFPANMARFTKIFAPSATKNAAPLFIMGSLGGIITNTLIGIASDYFESLVYGILILVFNAFILTIIELLLLFRFSTR
ncbi:MAG: MFS transporter [Pyrinomonadaceae bacterium]|nr:MFS transporter [Pyrinomonadaceae bacterium]MCX7639163.1 MFS transporter [Pyrinomonadaceae bacterium]MDW8303616.1 MFS transporter [Acidobacteriota bacterium]